MKTGITAAKPLAIGLLMIGGVSVFGAQAKAGPTETAIVAGGCFWCVEADFEKVKGVQSAVSGFAGGTTANPTYKQVTGGGTGHLEAVKITYDAGQVSYEQIINLFLRSVDPTDAGGQFCDRGESYTTAIFPLNADQKKTAEAGLQKAQQDLGQSVVTKIKAPGTFYPADAYHQDYYKKSDIVLTRGGPKTKASAYKFYRSSCGRDERVKQLWGSAAPFVG